VAFRLRVRLRSVGTADAACALAQSLQSISHGSYESELPANYTPNICVIYKAK
jgi:hypothetical protein